MQQKRLCKQPLRLTFALIQVQDKIKSQFDIIERFERTLEREETALRETIASLLQEVRSPALLELDATPDDVKPTIVSATFLKNEVWTVIVEDKLDPTKREREGQTETKRKKKEKKRKRERKRDRGERERARE